MWLGLHTRVIFCWNLILIDTLYDVTQRRKFLGEYLIIAERMRQKIHKVMCFKVPPFTNYE